MKLLICPICGSNNILPIIDFGREEPPFVECLDCDNEIIPLATPQDDGVFRTMITGIDGSDVPVVAYKS